MNERSKYAWVRGLADFVSRGTEGAPLGAGRALDLYARRFEGHKLGLGEYVLCADEKTSIQARIRCHLSLPASPGQPVRVEHEYDRGGALAYLAAWDVHRAKLFGRLEPTTGIAPFGRLVSQFMSVEPYRSAKRVFLIVDNGSSHRGEKAVRRQAALYPNLVLVHLPVHASWLDQIEIYFSIVQRKVLRPNDSLSLDELGRRILDFQARYEESATPFEWKFTRRDLTKLLRRIAAHEQLPLAA